MIFEKRNGVPFECRRFITDHIPFVFLMVCSWWTPVIQSKFIELKIHGERNWNSEKGQATVKVHSAIQMRNGCHDWRASRPCAFIYFVSLVSDGIFWCLGPYSIQCFQFFVFRIANIVLEYIAMRDLVGDSVDSLLSVEKFECEKLPTHTHKMVLGKTPPLCCFL